MSHSRAKGPALFQDWIAKPRRSDCASRSDKPLGSADTVTSY